MAEILDTLKALDDAHGDDIEQWFSRRRKECPPHFYSSVDLRHSGLKLAPVDTNLYPAGFNNLSPRGRARASRFIARFLQDQHPQVRRIVVVPENHTRNVNYLENLATLLALFENLGLEVQLGSLSAQAGQPIELESPSGRRLVEHPMRRDGRQLVLENGFVPDLVILNNDMTSGSPEILQDLMQPAIPPVGMGWYRRRKSVHFTAYRKLVDDFCQTFGMDSWLLAAEFHHCGFVDFKERTGLDCVANGIEKVLVRVREKYREYGITDAPYVFIKAESGTYGMGIMTARSPEDILDLNKKDRNKMQVIKEGTRNSEVIIQEGVPTVDLVNGKSAEPMVYMIDGVPIGGMYRVNGERDAYGNLNASGMEFTGMCDEMEEEGKAWRAVQDCHFRAYGIVSAIAALAAARERYGQAADSLSAKVCG
jgi:glutamate--cysteine ligase